MLRAPIPKLVACCRLSDCERNALRERQVLAEAALLPRCHAQDSSGLTVGHKPERAVRPGPHIPDAFTVTAQEPLLLSHLFTVDLDAQQHPALEAAHDEIAAPGGKEIAAVEGHP